MNMNENIIGLSEGLQSALKAREEIIGGKVHMRDARGALMPIELVKPQDLLQDETVRKVMFFARDLSNQIARFKGHTFDDLNAFQSILEQEYQSKIGGKKGNTTYFSYDGLQKVQVQIADKITYGPEIQEAKKLIDECLIEWGASAHEVIRGLVNRVFSVEKEGQINRADLYSLMRMDVADERWQEAVRAIKDSIRVVGAKSYIRFYERENAEAAWRSITIDIAA